MQVPVHCLLEIESSIILSFLSNILLIHLDEIFADNIPMCDKDDCDGVVKPGISRIKFMSWISNCSKASQINTG